MIARNVPNTKTTFNLSEAYNQIAGAAFRFEAEGHLTLWIYLKHGNLEFHHCEILPLSDYFVDHLNCKHVTLSFSIWEWSRLGRKLSRVYFKNK